MSKFAKLFDVADTQLLVHLTTNDEGHPQVCIITELCGGEITVAPSYGPKDENEPWDEDLAWQKAEKYFNSIGQEEAEQIHAGITRMGNRA